MILKTSAILLGMFWSAAAAPPVGFETHYLNLGQGGHTIAIAANPGDGSIFIVAVAALSYGVYTNRVIKTDAKGNPIASFDFSFGAPSPTIDFTNAGFAGPNAVAVDSQGNLLVVGGTSPANFPSTAQLGPTPTGIAAFVVRIDSNLTRVMNGVLLGGAIVSVGEPPRSSAMAVTTDRTGNVYLTGSTYSPDFPVTPGAFQTTDTPIGFSNYAFVTKLSPDFNKILFSFYFGDDHPLCPSSACVNRLGQTTARTIGVDGSGAVTIGGVSDANLLNLGPGGSFSLPPQPWFPFLARFSSDGQSLEAFSNFGIPLYATNGITALALDGSGNTIVAGDSGPTPAPGPGKGFVAKLDPSFKNLLFINHFGSNTVRGLNLSTDGNIWITGTSTISSLPGGDPKSQTVTPYIAELASDGSTLVDLVLTPVAGLGMAASVGSSIAVLGSPDCFLLSNSIAQSGPFVVTSSANNISSGTVAPGELVSLYGNAIGPAMALNGQIVKGDFYSAFTTSLGGYQVLLNDIPAPLFYAGPNQINTAVPEAVVPLPIYEGAGQPATIKVVGPSATTNLPSVFVVPSRPQVFVGSETGFPSIAKYYAVAINQDGTMNSATNPAPLGSVVSVWATGLATQGGIDGAIYQEPSVSRLVPYDTSVVTTFGSLEVLYSGQAPSGVLGLSQVNFRMPQSPQTGDVIFFALQTSTATSDTVAIHVTPTGS